MSKAMNDDEVYSEMKKMVAFIKQEAMEKAREIKVKADEEFAIEKGKIVRQETINIDEAYERKRKHVEVQKKITSSNQNNKSRLRVLQAREDYLEQAFQEARGNLNGLTKDQGQYFELLKGLILQSLYALMEKDIKVICRSKDKALVERAAADAKQEFESSAGFGISTQVVPDLPESSAGGVKMSGYGGRISVDNTLDERLKLLEEKMLPEIRERLFGKNPNRRFYN